MWLRLVVSKRFGLWPFFKAKQLLSWLSLHKSTRTQEHVKKRKNSEQCCVLQIYLAAPRTVMTQSLGAIGLMASKQTKQSGFKMIKGVRKDE